MVDKKKQGRRNRINGADFERRVRKDLEGNRYIVIKNPNNVIDNSFKQGKSKYNPFTKTLMMNSGGFPDFIAYKRMPGDGHIMYTEQFPIGIECKSNGTLDKSEKERCMWLLNNRIFRKILIAEKTKEGRKVVICYTEFQ